MWTVSKGLLVAAAIALGSTAAQADIVVVTGVNNQGTDNVLPPLKRAACSPSLKEYPPASTPIIFTCESPMNS